MTFEKAVEVHASYLSRLVEASSDSPSVFSLYVVPVNNNGSGQTNIPSKNRVRQGPEPASSQDPRP